MLQVQKTAEKEALRNIVIFPVEMLVSCPLLIFYCRSKGGYKAVVLPQKEQMPKSENILV